MLDLFLLTTALNFFWVFLSWIPLYLLKSAGLFRLAKNAKREEAWIAWVPIINNYLIGELTEKRVWGLRGSKWILSGAPLVLFLMSFFSFGRLESLVLVFYLLYFVYYYCNLYELYRAYEPQKADIFLLLSILLPFTKSILIFLIRDDLRDSYKNKFDVESQRKEYQKNIDSLSFRDKKISSDKKIPVHICVLYPTDEVREEALKKRRLERIEEEVDEISSSLDGYLNRFHSDFSDFRDN